MKKIKLKFRNIMLLLITGIAVFVFFSKSPVDTATTEQPAVSLPEIEYTLEYFDRVDSILNVVKDSIDTIKLDLYHDGGKEYQK